MSMLFMDERSFTTNIVLKHTRSGILKSKENISKLKCNRSLKKKLKKYKLRKDGAEDPEILDVSQTLLNSLRIKSPNNQHFYSQQESEENKPNNYLTKMVRLKKNSTVIDSMPISIERCKNECEDDSISLASKEDRDKKQTDAFKVLMDSRNKSIGSNSPGKDKCEEYSVLQERANSKELRAKRILTLNRMAQAKGSLKKLEVEEYREENIKRKMKDRTQRLKHMIVGMGVKDRKKTDMKPSVSKLVEISNSPTSSGIGEHTDRVNIKMPLFETFDLFETTEVTQNSKVRKLSKEDDDFLKKLSPSIKKKENMLCYFQKINKDCNTLNDDIEYQNREKLIIKVKLKSKNRVKKKTKKNIIDTETKLLDNRKCDLAVMNQESQYNISDYNAKSKKRKRNENKVSDKEQLPIKNKIQCHNDNRPKRVIKKPIKYTDNFELTSSDEELHIFTPNKKKNGNLKCENTSQPIIVNPIDHVMTESCLEIKKNIKVKQEKTKAIKKKLQMNEKFKTIPKKGVKLAPIFVTKPALDSVAIEAKQKFLQSGVPSQLKKTSVHQSNNFSTDEFQNVVHIQQIHCTNTPKICETSNVICTKLVEDVSIQPQKDLFKKLLHISILVNHSMPKFQTNVVQILHDIKQSYPKFPVYRTYHLLREKSKGEFKDCVYPDLDNSVEIFNNIVDTYNIQPDKLNWADKYKPTTKNQVLGNFESIRELKRWLVNWTENVEKSKNNNAGSDSSDFYQSDVDNEEIMRNENNLLIIAGKVGTGKTLSVYAVAAELAIKVIEVNASTKRTGKIMLQDLQEATQSHKVDRGKLSTECLQKTKEVNATNYLLTVSKKRGRKKKDIIKDTITRTESPDLPLSQNNSRTGMSLILIDDADIVFDQDDGFSYAISQLIQSSKRPVILVTSSLNCPHLQKFSYLAKIIKMQPFLPRMLGTWLDIMCLVDNDMCSPGLGAYTLDFFKGDIRKTINCLQFYMNSQKHLSTIDDPGSFHEEETPKVSADDESSCVSWVDSEGWGDKNIGSSNFNNICKYFVNKESQLLHFLDHQNIFYIWWNLPSFLNYSLKCCNQPAEMFSKRNETKDTKDLNKIATILDYMSITDYLGALKEEANITSGPWQSFETDSVIDNENFATYNRNNHSINEISLELVIKGVADAQIDNAAENKTEISYPSTSILRERQKVVSQHRTLTNGLNPSTALDRRALALDYWPSCRSICRTEKSKTNKYSKRNNRFCHYLRSLNVVGKNEYFDNLAESLNFKK